MKKKKNLFTMLAAVIMVGAFGYPAYQMSQVDEAQISLVAPKECRVGELVTFDATDSDMDNIAWCIFPPTTNFRIINEGKQAIFSAEQPGDYTVTVAVANGKKVALTITHLHVLGSDSPLIPSLLDNVIPSLLDNVAPRFKQFEVPPLQNPEQFDSQPLDIRSWLPQKPQARSIDRVVKSLTNLSNMMKRDNFETEGEMIQAVAWSMSRATQKNETWEPFIINFTKYLENATSKQDCINQVDQVLQGLINETT